MTAGLATGRGGSSGAVLRALLGSAHLGPALAVTVLAALLAGAQGLGAARGALVVAAVLAGQLSIGWSNDLVDLARDRAAGRARQAAGHGRQRRVRRVRAACAAAVVACVVLSLAVRLRRRSGAPACCVAAGWAYNLGLKATLWSWLPYAVAFGGLHRLRGPGRTAGAALVVAASAAALLGVGAHLLNVLPDLADDAATGVRGLPHRARRAAGSPRVAAAVLVARGRGRARRCRPADAGRLRAGGRVAGRSPSAVVGPGSRPRARSSRPSPSPWSTPCCWWWRGDGRAEQLGPRRRRRRAGRRRRPRSAR